MRRLVREWLPLAGGALGGIAAAQIIAAADVPYRFVTAGGATVLLLIGLAIWAASGGAVVGMASWAIPAVVLSAVVLAWPTLSGLVLLCVVLILPLATTYRPIERLLGRYVSAVSGWVVALSLSPADRTTANSLRKASKATPHLQGELRRLDEPARVYAALRQLENAIRSVPAPDAEWQALIDERANALALYRDMLESGRPHDAGVAAAAMAGVQSMHDLLRHRSAAYRVLTHRFTRAD